MREFKPRTNLTDRFWKRVKKSEGCWIWTGSLDGQGYGQVKVERRNMKATRVAYELAYGPSDRSLFMCHHCDNPACVRPEHLYPGTRKQNMLDMHLRRRSTWGERSAHAKLTEVQIAEIRQRLRDNPGRGIQTRIAKEFGVRQDHISRIASGQRWGNLNEISV